MEPQDIKKLLKKYITGDSTPEERSLIESWYLQYEDSAIHDLSDEETLKEIQLIYEGLPGSKPVVKLLWSWNTIKIAVAAAAVVTITISLFYYPLTEAIQVKQEVNARIIAPGTHKAVLTLSDGTKIELDRADTGIVAEQSGVSIQKKADGRLVYFFADKSHSTSLKGSGNQTFNKIETPAGGDFVVNLPDGSVVHLNPSSSLIFPTAFNGKYRDVQLKGEGFFEVASEKAHPFRVSTKNQVVEVLGTRFNVNAYDDEPVIKTTLVEGSVKVIYKDNSVLLTPGEQSLRSNTLLKIKNAESDVEQILAWKEGFFLFKNEDIQSIMKKLSRWYDIDVSFKGHFSQVAFGGRISRSRNLEDVLKMIELTNSIQFKIEGRTVTVMQ